MEKKFCTILSNVDPTFCRSKNTYVFPTKEMKTRFFVELDLLINLAKAAALHKISNETVESSQFLAKCIRQKQAAANDEEFYKEL